MMQQWDGAIYQRVLGSELRRVRKRRGWTRKDLHDRLACDISMQALATYEWGTRLLSMTRLVEICRALDELPYQLLARVHEQVFFDAPVTGLRIDLPTIVRDPTPQLHPLRRWAATRIADQTGSADTETELDIAALDRMAELCQMPTPELITRLRQLHPPAGASPAAS